MTVSEQNIIGVHTNHLYCPICCSALEPVEEHRHRCYRCKIIWKFEQEFEPL